MKIFRPEKEIELAEELGLGIWTGTTFTLKKSIRDEISTICIPNASKKEVIGVITHVSLDKILSKLTKINLINMFPHFSYIDRKLFEILVPAENRMATNSTFHL